MKYLLVFLFFLASCSNFQASVSWTDPGIAAKQVNETKVNNDEVSE